jgi:DHA3 family macrolide efflux protein-like MFS transporter
VTQSDSVPANWKTPFITLFASQALSLFGSALVQFALVWWLTQTTGSATVLALASLAAMLPNVLLAPVAGVLVDRWPRRRVMMVADALVALATVALAVLFYLGAVQIWHVYLALLIRAAAGTFQYPAMQASTSLMVPKEQLARVAGFNQTLHGAMNIAAPPIGALLLGLLPMQGVLAVDVVTAALAIGTLFFLTIPQPAPAAAGAAKPSLWGEMRAGLDYLLAWPGMLALLLMATVINFLLSPAGALMPILVTKHFGGGVGHLATLESTFGVATVVGGLALGMWGGFRRRMHTALGGLLGIGIGFALMGFAPANAFWFAVAAASLAAFMLPITNGPIMAVMQAAVAPEMQGRVFSLDNAVSTAMAPLGLLIAGPVADAFGVQTWYMVGGVACLLIGIAAFFIPAIVRLEDGRTYQAVTATATGGES